MQTELKVPFFDYPSVFISEEEELIGLFREVARERRPLYGESDFRGQGHIEHRVRRLLRTALRGGGEE